MERMLVVAPKGKTCPKELSRELIGDAEEISVPNNHYYRCRIASGELLFKGHAGAKEAGKNKSPILIDRKKRGGKNDDIL